MDELYQYVIYHNAKDCPNKYLLRKWIIKKGHVQASSVIAINDTIEEVRKFLPQGVSRLPVYANDDKVISEVWM